MSFPKTTRFGADPTRAEELANKQYVDAQTGEGIDLTTKGDLHGFDTVDKRIAIGADATVLTADAAEALGLKWAAPAGGSGQTFARVVKKADETISNSSTLQDDDELFVALSASKTYAWQLFIKVRAQSASDFKYAWTLPSGAVGRMRTQGDWDGVSEINDVDMTVALFSTVTITANWWLNQQGTVVVDTTAGNMQLQWAQNTAVVEDTTMQEGALLVVWEETA